MEDRCDISVFRDGKIVHFESVPKGTKTITMSEQTGTGTVKYVIHINGERAWEVEEVFTKAAATKNGE